MSAKFRCWIVFHVNAVPLLLIVNVADVFVGVSPPTIATRMHAGGLNAAVVAGPVVDVTRAGVDASIPILDPTVAAAGYAKANTRLSRSLIAVLLINRLAADNGVAVDGGEFCQSGRVYAISNPSQLNTLRYEPRINPYNLKILFAPLSHVIVIDPPFGVTGKPELVAGASARDPAVMIAANAVTVIVRSPALANADNVADAPLENVSTVPLGIPATSRSTATVVALAAACAAQVTMCRPSISAAVRDVDAVPVSL